MDWRKRKIALIVGAVVICALALALQFRIEHVVRENDLPPQCAMRGQGCPTTTTEGPRAAE